MSQSNKTVGANPNASGKLRVTVSIYKDTYDKLVKQGDLTDSFDSTISRLLKNEGVK